MEFRLIRVSLMSRICFNVNSNYYYLYLSMMLSFYLFAQTEETSHILLSAVVL